MRWKALDELRGFSMLLLVVLAPLFLFPSVPAWLKHAPGNGFHVADLVAPMFLFAIGLSYPLSLERRLKTNEIVPTALIFGRRYLMLFVFGLLGEAAKYRDLTFSHWGMFEEIGFSGIVVFPLMFTSVTMRLLMSGLGLMIWQIMLVSGYEPTALSFDLGGPFATLSWAGIILVASSVSQWRQRSDRAQFRKRLIAVAVLTAAGAGGTGWLIPINKHLVTAPYILVGIACSIGVLLFFEILATWQIEIRICSIFGKNSILLYIAAGFETIGIVQFAPHSLALGDVLALATVACALCIALAWSLDRQRIYVKI